MLFVLIFLIKVFDDSLNMNIDDNLTMQIEKHLNDFTGVELMYYDNNYIHGHFYNLNSSSVVLDSIGLFRYNIKTLEFEYFDFNSDKRIMTFLFVKQKIYYIALKENDNVFYWEFIESNFDFSDEIILKTGYIDNPLNYPRLLYDSNFICLISIEDIANDLQAFQFDLVEKENLQNLKNEMASKKEKSGDILYNIANVYLEDNNIYYTIVDGNNKQYLRSFNILTREENNLYQNSNDNIILYNYKIMESGIYIQYALKSEDNKSYFIFDYNDGKQYKKKGNIKTMDTKLNLCIVFHNFTNDIEIFSETKRKLFKKRLNIGNMYPKYIVVEDKILMQDFDNNFYYSDSLENICG